MIRKHSTRLSQVHDEEPEDEGAQHRTAASDYPEMGTVLDDRPDPGRQITVIGMRRRADAYGTGQDARNGEYSGGEGDLGMYWAEPGQQKWTEEHLGPQQEASPPLYDPDMMPPAMARLAALEEARAFFGMSRHATTVNGIQVDDAGDAPQHGTVPRAQNPDSYDDASHEGEGDGKWDDPLPWGSKKDENAATVGMYPEGIGAGGGPGISVGPFTAAMSREEFRELRGHMLEHHGFSDQDPDYGDPKSLAENHAGLHDAGGSGHVHGEDYEFNPWWEEGDTGRYHGFTGMRRDARVPWTGKERGTLHRWQEAPTVTWGDFVPSSEFPALKPGEHVSHEDEGDGIGAVEGSWRQVPLAGFTAAFNVHVRIDGKELHGHDDDQDDGPAPQHGHDDPADSLDENQDSPPDNAADKNGPEIKSPQFSPGNPQDSQADKAPVNPGDPMNDPANWPQTGADVSERSRAYTQGSGDGKVTRGGAPAAFSPDDGDSGGGGDQGDEEDGGDQPDDAGTPFSKDGALAMFTAAAGSPAFRFEFTAAWHDVVAKAKRIRAEGHVRIVHATPGMVIGEVRGDHDTYESGIQRPVGKRQAIQHWACGCPWASFHQDKSAGTRYAGRPCSHVMALQFEAQSRGMFGRASGPDAGVPSWSPETVVVKSWPPYEGEPHAGRWREEWRAPLARQTAGAGKPYLHQPDDDDSLAAHIVHHHGLGADNMAAAIEAGASQDHWRRWHDSEHRYSTALTHQHDEPQGVPGEHRWPDLFEPESGFHIDDWGGRETSYPPEGSYGGVRHEKFKPEIMPHWSSLGAPADRATRVLVRAGEDPGAVGALRLLAGLRATADQANAPWGSDNVTSHPPQKPYGATSPPNKDQDPGSYGPLAAPDPENWGGIQEDSAYQMPIGNTAAHQVLVPGAPHPAPGDLHWPDMNGWQAEDQGAFGYTDRAGTAGPSTAMDPRDPDGIRMEEVRRATAAGTPFPYHGTVPQLDGALAELKDEPEAALPSTTGDDEIEATAAADGTIGGGDAAAGTGQDAAGDEASLGEFGAVRRHPELSGRISPDQSGSVRTMFRTKFGGIPMGDLNRETSPQAQQPSPAGQEPGTGSADDALSPDDPSIQTTGNQQWSGGGADSDETAVPAGQPQGGIDDIVASFQRSAASKTYAGSRAPGHADGDIAVAARQYLAKTADVLPKAEADELVREGAGSRARNLDLLRLEGTHYEDEDEDLAKKGLSLDGYDDDVIFA